MSEIDRGFVRIAEGLAHYRAVAEDGTALPLVLLHASPGSSRGLEPLLTALSETGRAPRLIAPDTLGHGESAAPAPAAPDIRYYADALFRMLNAIGIDRAFLYGAHTGARIACEAAVLFPDRIAGVLLDGIADYEGATREDLLLNYAPEMAPDDYGRQFVWAFNFVRDQALHFPHYARDPANRLMTRAVPNAERLHQATLDVLRSLGTYHKAYRAAFAYRTRERLALCPRPLALLDAEGELPMLRAQMAGLLGAARDAEILPAGQSPKRQGSRNSCLDKCRKKLISG